jgi:hypothetical protein
VTSPSSIDNEKKWNKLTQYNRNKTESGKSEQTMAENIGEDDAGYGGEGHGGNMGMEGIQIKPGLRVDVDPNVGVQVPMFLSCQDVVVATAFFERTKEVCVSEAVVGAAINGESLEEMTLNDYVKLFKLQIWVVKDDSGGITHTRTQSGCNT